MVITLGPEVEAALNEVARRQGVAPDVLAVNALRDRFLAAAAISRGMSGSEVYSRRRGTVEFPFPTQP